MKNSLIICKDFTDEEVKKISERINSMPAVQYIISNRPVEIVAWNRVWVNPFYCENFGKFMHDMEWELSGGLLISCGIAESWDIGDTLELKIGMCW